MTRSGSGIVTRSLLHELARLTVLRIYSTLRHPTPTRVWLGVFALWSLLLTGFLGSPGLQQAFRLQFLLNAKNAQIETLQGDLVRLHSEALQLEKSRVAQLREIRRVLGYAASDELIFDFTGGIQP